MKMQYFNTNKSSWLTAKANLDKLVLFCWISRYRYHFMGIQIVLVQQIITWNFQERRAAAVKIIWTVKESSRFQVTGLGIVDPIASNETVEGRTWTEFAITANEKWKDAEAEVKNYKKVL
jgi:hypothetical protein